MRRHHDIGTRGDIANRRPVDRGQRPRRARALVAVAAASTVAAAAVVVATVSDIAFAQDPPPVSAPVALDGTTPATAGASCWEIKQTHPTSADGVYWLRNSTLERPDQFYCDMTTDGGGWVLIGRGREGWTFRDYGQSTIERVRTDVDGPAAFSPAALSSETIDGLLDGGAVKDLPDGIRIRRATNKSGTSWQDLRWTFADLTAWSWAFGGGHHLATFAIDGDAGTGSNTRDSGTRMNGETGSGNRNAGGIDGWFTYPWSGHGRSAGFSFKGSVDGDNNSSSYLWEYSNENNAIPFTQLFLRPEVTTPTLTPIGDAGTAAQTLSPMLDDRPAELAGGVRGVLKVGDSEPHLDTPVLAITTLGDRVYVGGKFAQVRDTATGNLVDHPYLAAFDRETGAWIPSFDPQLDGTVWDLDTAGGRLIVAGQFTNVDGVDGTSAMAALDPTTGAVDPTWRASFTLSGSSARPLARAIDVEGDWIYVGGNFTRIDGATHSAAEGRLGRVAVSNGNPDDAFRPNVDGVPYDVDAADGLVQFVGYLSGTNGDDRRGVGTVDANTGATITGLADPVWTTSKTSRRYQQAVLAVGSEVWQGGSEHNVHVYDRSDYRLLKAYVAWNQGGDTQAFALAGNKVIQGSHANAWTYEDGVTWPGLDGYTRADVYNWVGSFDATTHRYDRDFVPSIRSAYTEGDWALHTDSDGCVWFGGDFLGGPYVNGQRQYLESFSKFCPRDTIAPTVPTNAVATTTGGGGVTLTWSHSSDNAPGYIGYEVLRNDRVVSPLVYGSTYVDPDGTAADRYFVRAVDPTGNRSASTAVLVPGDNLAPTTPTDLVATVNADNSVDLTWTASTDDVEVASYRVLRNGVEIATVPGTETSTTITGLARGTHWIQLQAVDNAGNESYRTPSAVVDVGGDDTAAPTVPTDLVASADQGTGLIDVSWAASTDDVGVTGYLVYRNGVQVQTVAGDVTSVQLDLGYGVHYIQVAATDDAGNVSAKTPSAVAEVIAPDTSAPSTPTGLTAVVGAGDSVDVAWSASSDDVGVDHYVVTRNGVEVAVVPGSETSVNVTGLGPGTHYMQVQAFDAAGNKSYRTPSAVVTI